MSTSVQDRLNAALSGRYRIAGQLGEGGMASVFLADDLRHDRKVALKVLKPELAAVVGAERFLAEIRTTANLHHPHILPLFDSGEADGFLFYVMPYLGGETLREHLDRDRQLPVEEAVRIATAVANALDHAHRNGVIHRDIKPANILLQDGEPVVADFGIALAVGGAGAQRLTETGLSVGTPYYMSPEQATGDQVIGPQSDTYALGCVLFEMLTGEPPYPGATAQAVLGKIIQGQPVSATSIRPTVPLHIDAAIRRALEKLPADRFGSSADFARALADPSFRHGPAAVAAAPDRRWRVAAAAMALVSAVALGTLAVVAARPAPASPVIRYTMRFAEEELPTTGDGAFGSSLAISPDGSTLAYVGPATEGLYGIWVRERDELEGRLLSGTEMGVQPFFSPDGRRVGFVVTGSRQIKIASLGGEPPRALVDSGVYRLGAAWGDDGHVYFSAMPGGGLYRVNESGGEVEQLSTPDSARGETRHAWPDPLPSGRGVLLTVQRGNNVYTAEDDVAVLDLRTGEVRILFRATLARYLPTGHVVLVSHDGTFIAVPFDEDALEVTGPPAPILDGITGNVRGPDVALSRSGRLAYQPSVPPTAIEVAWIDRAGRGTPVEAGWTINPAANAGPRLSPDQRRIAVDLRAEDDGGIEIWIKELGGPLSRLAFEGRNDGRASWSTDGRSVLYISDAGSDPSTDFHVWTRRADGSGGPRLVLDPDLPISEARWVRDGEELLVRGNGPVFDIFGYRPGVDSELRPLVATAFPESAPTLSRDRRFLAYVGGDSGRPEVYVRPFPNVDDARVQVSTDGGVEPLWAHSGRELFYKNEARQLVAVQVDTEREFRVTGREVLFPLPPGASYYPQYTQYDVTSDDQRFLMFRLAGGVPVPVLDRFIVVENFHEELRALIGS